MTYPETQWVLQNEQADEKRRLRKGGLFVGLSLIGILITQLAAGALIGAPLTTAEAAMATSLTARLWYYALYIGFYVVMLLLPTAVLALIFRRRPRVDLPRERVKGGDALLMIACGLALCVLANYLVNYWLQFVSLFGIEPYEGDYNNDGGWLALGLNLVTYALLPGVIEELVFRGWVLGALQPFGERRALLLSALLFGLLHGNLTQMPFALLLGLVFGFIALRTGRLWPCMIIHAANNGMSVLLDYASVHLGLSENQSILLNMGTFAVLTIVGVTAGLILRHRRAELLHPLTDRRSVVANADRARMMWLSPAILIAILAMVALTVLQEVVVV